MTHGTAWTVNSEHTLNAYIAQVKADYAEHKYLTYPKPRIGADRSLSQNGLMHVWLAELWSFAMRKDKRDMTEGDMDGIKRAMKKRYFEYSREPWLIHKVTDPFSLESKNDFRSSRKWLKGEMFNFLTWLQMYAAEADLILESKGEHEKLRREQHEV